VTREERSAAAPRYDRARHAAHRRQVQVVTVIVRDELRVDDRQLLRRHVAADTRT
jgi:hypothetical protein